MNQSVSQSVSQLVAGWVSEWVYGSSGRLGRRVTRGLGCLKGMVLEKLIESSQRRATNEPKLTKESRREAKGSQGERKRTNWN